MPTKATIKKTRTRKGADGTVKIMVVGCKTDNGMYLAYGMDLPTAIVKGEERGRSSNRKNCGPVLPLGMAACRTCNTKGSVKCPKCRGDWSS